MIATRTQFRAKCILGIGLLATITLVLLLRKNRETLSQCQTTVERPVTRANPKTDRMQSALMEKDNQKRLIEIDKIVVEWSNVDVDVCLNRALQLENIIDKQTALTSIFLAVLDQKDLKKALEVLERIPRGDLRDDAIAFGMRKCLNLDFDKAMRLTSQVSGRGMINSVARKVSEALLDPAHIDRLSSVLDNVPYGAFRTSLAQELVSKMATDNPQSALGWLNAQKDFPNPSEAAISIACSFGITDPAGGVEASKTIANKAAQDKFMTCLGATWARNKPSEAGTWLLGNIQNSGYAANSAIAKGLISEWIQWDHDEPFLQIAKVMNEDDRNALTLEAAQDLAKFDPLKASAIIGGYLDSPDKATLSVVRGVARNWLERDSIQASNWISGLQQGPAKDASIDVLVDNILSTDGNVEAARNWAANVNSNELRTSIITRISNSK